MWLVIIADMLFVLVSLQPVFSLFLYIFFSMNVSRNKNHNDFRSSIFNHFLCCMFCCCFFFRPFFSLHSYGEGRKILFLYFFVFSFDHNSQKTPTHLMMYQYSDSNLEETSSLFSFFREFTFGSVSFTFFFIGVWVILWEEIEEIHWIIIIFDWFSPQTWQNHIQFYQRLNMCALIVGKIALQLCIPLKDFWYFSLKTLYGGRHTFEVNGVRS